MSVSEKSYNLNTEFYLCWNPTVINYELPSDHVKGYHSWESKCTAELAIQGVQFKLEVVHTNQWIFVCNPFIMFRIYCWCMTPAIKVKMISCVFYVLTIKEFLSLKSIKQEDLLCSNKYFSQTNKITFRFTFKVAFHTAQYTFWLLHKQSTTQAMLNHLSYFSDTSALVLSRPWEKKEGLVSQVASRFKAPHIPCSLYSLSNRMALAQHIVRVVHYLQGCGCDSCFPLSTCQSVLDHDNEPQLFLRVRTVPVRKTHQKWQWIKGQLDKSAILI